MKEYDIESENTTESIERRNRVSSNTPKKYYKQLKLAAERYMGRTQNNITFGIKEMEGTKKLIVENRLQLET